MEIIVNTYNEKLQILQESRIIQLSESNCILQILNNLNLLKDNIKVRTMFPDEIHEILTTFDIIIKNWEIDEDIPEVIYLKTNNLNVEISYTYNETLECGDYYIKIKTPSLTYKKHIFSTNEYDYNIVHNIYNKIYYNK